MKNIAAWQELFCEILMEPKQDYLVRGREILVRMRDVGVGVDDALEALQDMRSKGEGVLTERQDDCIMDWMDILYGWCSPDFKVWKEFPKGYWRHLKIHSVDRASRCDGGSVADAISYGCCF